MVLEFASDGASVIDRKVEIDKQNPIKDASCLEINYEISRCVKWIIDNGFQHVALQFSDEMLVDSAAIVFAIKAECNNCNLYILADTSYGSCCVDEVAAEHVAADSVIHFGHSCLSPTSRLPALFVFGKKQHDLEDAVAQFQALFPERNKNIIMYYDVIYIHLAEQLYAKLVTEYQQLIMSLIDFEQLKLSPRIPQLTESCCKCTDKCCTSSKIKEGESYPKGTLKKLGRIISFPLESKIEDYCVFYLGTEGPCLLNLMMSFNKCSFYSYNPETGTKRQETLAINKSLMRRYYLIERAKEASVVGILIGTLGVSDYLSIINQLKQLIKNAGKKAYTLVVGKINVAKLANFPEIEVFVLVACPENSLMDSKDFYKPIVTPFEMEIACNAARSWTGDYVTDFRQLLPGAADYIENTGEQTTDMSLISGRVLSLTVNQETENDSEQALVKRDNMSVALPHEKAAGAFFAERSWKGLETHPGIISVEKATKGQHGTASSYQNEGEVFKDDNANQDT